MKIIEDPRLPIDPANMSRRLTDIFRALAQQINGLTEGRMSAKQTARTSVPVGAYGLGDFVENSAPAELGSPGSKYIVYGWKCTVAGDPATFVEVRTLTGN